MTSKMVCSILKYRPVSYVVRNLHQQTVKWKDWLIHDSGTTVQGWLQAVNPICDLISLAEPNSTEKCVPTREVERLEKLTTKSPRVQIQYRDRIINRTLPCTTTLSPLSSTTCQPCAPCPTPSPCPAPRSCPRLPIEPLSRPCSPVACIPEQCIPPSKEFFSQEPKSTCTEIVLEQIIYPQSDNLEVIIYFLISATLWYLLGYKAPTMFFKCAHYLLALGCECYYALAKYTAYCIRRKWQRARHRFNPHQILMPELSLAQVKANVNLTNLPCSCCRSGKSQCGQVLYYEQMDQGHPLLDMIKLLETLEGALKSKNDRDMVLLPQLNELSAKLASSLFHLETHLMSPAEKTPAQQDHRSLTRRGRVAPLIPSQETSLAALQASSLIHNEFLEGLQQQVSEVDKRLGKAVQKTDKRTSQSLAELEKLRTDYNDLKLDLHQVFVTQSAFNEVVESQILDSKKVLSRSINLSDNRSLSNRSTTRSANLDLVNELAIPVVFPNVSALGAGNTNTRETPSPAPSSGRGTRSSRSSSVSSASTMQNSLVYGSTSTLGAEGTSSVNNGRRQQNIYSNLQNAGKKNY